MKLAYSKAELVVIRVLLKTEKISKEHYLPWCYQLIEQLEEPPQWLLDISYAQDGRAVEAILHSYIYREGPVGEVPYETDLEIAVLYLDYQAGEINWEDFLLKAGQLSDCCEGRIECSWFFGLLNAYEAVSGMAQNLRKDGQEQEIKKTYQSEIRQVWGCRMYFENFYNRNVR